MFSGTRLRPGGPVFGLLAVALAWMALVGCGSSHPYDVAKVSGKITYEDGSLIPGSRIHLEFTPLCEPIDKVAPKPGVAEADVNDGTFAYVTSFEFSDGLIVGKHDLTAFSCDENNQQTVLEVVPRQIEITQGDNRLELKVKKP